MAMTTASAFSVAVAVLVTMIVAMVMTVFVVVPMAVIMTMLMLMIMTLMCMFRYIMEIRVWSSSRLLERPESSYQFLVLCLTHHRSSGNRISLYLVFVILLWV